MSVNTKTSELLDEIRQNIKSAQKSLLIVLDNDTWGHSDLSPEYIKKLYQIATQLVDIQTEL